MVAQHEYKHLLTVHTSRPDRKYLVPLDASGIDQTRTVEIPSESMVRPGSESHSRATAKTVKQPKNTPPMTPIAQNTRLEATMIIQMPAAVMKTANTTKEATATLFSGISMAASFASARSSLMLYATRDRIATHASRDRLRDLLGPDRWSAN